MTLSEELIEDDFDQKNARSFEWTADNKLRRFRITRNDGTVKEILFSDIVADRKLRKLVEKKITNLPRQIEGAISSSWKKDYELLLIEFKSLLEDSKK